MEQENSTRKFDLALDQPHKFYIDDIRAAASVSFEKTTYAMEAYADAAIKAFYPTFSGNEISDLIVAQVNASIHGTPFCAGKPLEQPMAPERIKNAFSFVRGYIKGSLEGPA